MKMEKLRAFEQLWDVKARMKKKMDQKYSMKKSTEDRDLNNVKRFFRITIKIFPISQR